jgi:hypothetical protein
MDDVRERVEEIIKHLSQERDELRVKMHLAKMEATDEWKELEVKLAKLDVKARELGGTTMEASKDIGAAAVLLGEEIRDGFKKLAGRL